MGNGYPTTKLGTAQNRGKPSLKFLFFLILVENSRNYVQMKTASDFNNIQSQMTETCRSSVPPGRESFKEESFRVVRSSFFFKKKEDLVTSLNEDISELRGS